MNVITLTICLLGMVLHWTAHIGVGKSVILQFTYLYLSQPSLTCIVWLSDRSLLARCFPAVIFIMSPCTFNFCSFIKHNLNLITTGLHMCVTLMCKSSSFCTVDHLCHYQWTGASYPCTVLFMSAVLSVVFATLIFWSLSLDRICLY